MRGNRKKLVDEYGGFYADSARKAEQGSRDSQIALHMGEKSERTGIRAHSLRGQAEQSNCVLAQDLHQRKVTRDTTTLFGYDFISEVLCF